MEIREWQIRSVSTQSSPGFHLALEEGKEVELWQAQEEGKWERRKEGRKKKEWGIIIQAQRNDGLSLRLVGSFFRGAEINWADRGPKEHRFALCCAVTTDSMWQTMLMGGMIKILGRIPFHAQNNFDNHQFAVEPLHSHAKDPSTTRRDSDDEEEDSSYYYLYFTGGRPFARSSPPGIMSELIPRGDSGAFFYSTTRFTPILVAVVVVLWENKRLPAKLTLNIVAYLFHQNFYFMVHFPSQVLPHRPLTSSTSESSLSYGIKRLGPLQATTRQRDMTRRAVLNVPPEVFLWNHPVMSRGLDGCKGNWYFAFRIRSISRLLSITMIMVIIIIITLGGLTSLVALLNQRKSYYQILESCGSRISVLVPLIFILMVIFVWQISN